MIRTLIFILFIYPTFALAEIDTSERMLQITESDWFAVTGWNPPEEGEAWTAKSNIEGLTVHVSPERFGLIELLTTEDQVKGLLIRCSTLVEFSGISSSDSDRVFETMIQSFADQAETQLELESYSFEVNSGNINEQISWASCAFVTN